MQEFSRDIDENKVVRLDELVLPAASISSSVCGDCPVNIGEKQLQALSQSVSLSLDGRESKFGLESKADLDSISLDQPLENTVNAAKKRVFMNKPFVLALYDQQTKEELGLEKASLLLCAKVAPQF